GRGEKDARTVERAAFRNGSDDVRRQEGRSPLAGRQAPVGRVSLDQEAGRPERGSRGGAGRPPDRGEREQHPQTRYEAPHGEKSNPVTEPARNVHCSDGVRPLDATGAQVRDSSSPGRGTAFAFIRRMRGVWLVLVLEGCDGAAQVEVARATHGGDAALELRLGTTSVSIEGAFARDGEDLNLPAHTNRTLAGGQALARDGPDGALDLTTSHAFVLRWPDGELGVLAEGTPRLVELDFRPTARAPPRYGLRLVFGLRLEADGLDAPLARDGGGYVIGGQSIAAGDVWAHVGGEPLALVRTSADGTVAVVEARVVLAVERLGLCEGDPRSV